MRATTGIWHFVLGAIIFIASAVVVVITINQVREFASAIHDPFVVISSAAEPAVLRTTDTKIKMRYVFDRIRYCPTDLNLFIVDDSTHEIVWRNRVIGGATRLGHADVINVFDIPQLSPGHYLFRTISYSTCTAADVHTTAFDDAPFEVVP